MLLVFFNIKVTDIFIISKCCFCKYNASLVITIKIKVGLCDFILHDYDTVLGQSMEFFQSRH